MPILGEPELLHEMILVLCSKLENIQFNRILGIESRGFLIGPLLAQRLKLPFSPIRKKGKLPGELYTVEYELEYGKDVLEVQKHSLPDDSKCLIVDDLMATGGSLLAAKKLVELAGSKVAAYAVVIELKSLKGASRLCGSPIISLFAY